MNKKEEVKMLYWRPFAYKETTFDLSHIHPFLMNYTQPAKSNKPEHTYKINVAFSLHCFTRRINEHETPDNELLYSDSRETRVFDFKRYELSKQLKEIICNLGDRKCYHTGAGNYFTVDILNPDGVIEEYYVFFYVYKPLNKGRLNLFVQSAYIVPERKPKILFRE